MPIYEIGEHEILSDEATILKDDGESDTGVLYLSDRRLLFERKGRRGFIKATPPKITIDIRLYRVSNVTSAVPRIKAMTKKNLMVEYEEEGEVKKVRFRLGDPRDWEDKMRKWISDAKRLEEEKLVRSEEEHHRRDVEMARAKAGTTNVGVAYYGKPNNSAGKKIKNKEKAPETIIDAETSDSTEIRKAEYGAVEQYSNIKCPNCGEPMSKGMKFCPNCGEKV